MNDRVFSRATDEYKRNINPIRDALEQSAIYLSTMTGDPYEKCLEYLRNKVKNGGFDGRMKNPTVVYFERPDGADRHKTEISLTGYINTVLNNNEVLAPSFTAYVNPKKRASILVSYMDANVKKRSINKKAAFKAKAEKNKALYTIKNNEQTANKLKNNACSGGFVAGGCVINNPSAHSTLTSTTRTVSSFGNASNERVVSGNRHYRDTNIALFNILSIISRTDYEKVEQAMSTLGLKYPSAQETYDCMYYSLKLYNPERKGLMEIRALIDRLTPLQRAVVVYTGDLYHLRIHNPEFMHGLISKMSQKTDEFICDDPLSYMKKLDENTAALVHLICREEVKGIGKEYEKIPEHLALLASCGINIQKTIQEKRVLFEAFFVTDNVPPSVAYIPDMCRRAVVLSDTDSTCFSTDEWMMWYSGKDYFDRNDIQIGGAVAYVVTETVVHILALLSSNIGVDKSRLGVLAMKNEYLWPVMIPTAVAKHYYALTWMREGAVYATLEEEIKGVHLKNSSSPESIVNHSARLMVSILTEIYEKGKVHIVPYIQEVAAIERKIVETLLSGDISYFRSTTIKDKGSYKLDETKSPYRNYVFWNEVFLPKYGEIDPPEYSAIKVPTTLVNPTAFRNWIDGITDKDFSERLRAWALANGKKEMPTLYMPVDFIISNGMPEEVRPVINTKHTAIEMTNAYRLVFASLGIFFKQDYLITEHGY